MADKDNIKDPKNYYLNVENKSLEQFPVKGAQDADWGMKNRLASMFNPKSGNTVMLAFDHGYIMGPTSGLERLDIAIPPLLPHVDVLMGTRGAIRTSIPPTTDKAICLRVSYDSSVLYDDMSLGGGMACDIENAIKMNPACLATQTFIGAAGEKNSLELLARTVDEGTKYNIPTLGIVAVGKEMERTEKFFLLATRILAENGAQVIKSYYCEGFERVVAACPVPIVIAGGKKVPESEALTMAYRAISEGARGVDMGRNIFQAENPQAMCQAIGKVVHEGFNDIEAYEFYKELLK
ncbi:3-hydroxy-5-phosphonooxypentane-2,4-dione thiolase [Anaerosphaera multitolerans]|uniref:3-hydroxy-5-phosphonooxypentane-2,4-dione thiolase n=1 Tax=Anaerosphaera multitolerans TaxID=2487351 RepID=A0A437S7H0_9FIRM|nr:3-hydroxy-5-phosphonooxypentane-2,4-dione thiolase [Anaerosphaera multitolerans]RVU55020.1 3-hydroxy-5-phosphonooxypentane-2,4-dione thiolase [Anaerosphaera multitolerans]